ncbi:MAG: sulfatase-like hydrolase/transferase [Deltaproteobacteria bacterium]|nr:sulfatase-like hydrolase/transferase [Deltaproteobacteria bacterium]
MTEAATRLGASTQISNVLLLTVDCLRYAYLAAGGNAMNICPTINHLARSGILCSNARAHGFPSQMTFPTIFTSTLPLDCGGYDAGILNRPRTLVEVLQEAGLYTTGFSTSPWLGHLFGYARGFDEFYELFDVNIFWKTFSTVYHKFYYNLLSGNTISQQEFCRIVGDLFGRYLADMLRQCTVKQQELAEKKFPYHMTLHRHSFKGLIEALRSAQREFNNDPDTYVVNRLTKDIVHDIALFLSDKKTQCDINTSLVKLLDHTLRLLWIQVWRQEYSVPSSYLRRLINETIVRHRQKPFFIWTHFLDVHDNTYVSGRVGLPPDGISLGLQRARDPGNPAGLKSIYCLRFVDRQISRIIANLDAEGLLEKTLVVISGDHGTPHTCTEKSPGSLFDELVRVPLIFYNPQLQPRVVSDSCGLRDIAPTILDILGQDRCSAFEGESLLRQRSADTPVILESLGAGPGDFQYKPIKMAVLHGKYKLIWHEPGYEKTYSAGNNYLFDVAADPEERTNLYSSKEHQAIVKELESVVCKRCNTLRKQSRKEE